MKDLLTASRMAKLLFCPRAHYWAYEIGLKSTADATALRFGSAWHRAMEARWNGADYETALTAAIGEKTITDEYEVATLAGMLTGYYATYASEPLRITSPEEEFCHPIDGSRSFDAAGKIDGYGLYDNGLVAAVEHKTTSASVEPDSDYWLRLRANPQVLQYWLALKDRGVVVDVVIYDVARKPSIAPKQVNDLDGEGFKIVNDATGARVMKKDGTPRESGDTEKGYVVQSHLETPEEFANRLAADTQERPQFYFARREVPILHDDATEFEANRLELGRQILAYRQNEKRYEGAAHRAWPRNICTGCERCEYASFCLQNITPTPTSVPAGFRMGVPHEELNQVTQEKA